MKALIIGGGIGGVSAAVALRRVGIEAVVFEQAEGLRKSARDCQSGPMPSRRSGNWESEMRCWAPARSLNASRRAPGRVKSWRSLNSFSFAPRQGYRPAVAFAGNNWNHPAVSAPAELLRLAESRSYSAV